VVEWGNQLSTETALECCRACRRYEPSLDVLNGSQCNTWVWHPERHECWLKHQEPRLLQAAALQVSRREGIRKETPWTSGLWLGTKWCTACEVPTDFTGCISKDTCNTTHNCGSPAIDGYAHVDSGCLERSGTAAMYRDLIANATTLQAFHEERADYDGLGVKWGVGHRKERWQDCEQACRDHKPTVRGGPFSRLPCNVWTWCSQPRCFEPDAHTHSFGDCWLKFSEDPHAPEVNMRWPMLPSFMRRHRKQMEEGVPWTSGVLLPPGVAFTNGTWGPRAYW